MVFHFECFSLNNHGHAHCIGSPNWIGFSCPTLSVHRLHLETLFLCRNNQINNFDSVLFLGISDVLGLLVDLLVGEKLPGDGSVSHIDLLDDSGRLHFDSVHGD